MISFKKIISLTAALMVGCMAFTGCGGSDSSSSSASTESTSAESTSTESTSAESTAESEADTEDELKAPVNDGAVDVEAGCTENMLIRSVYQEGDTSRLAAKLKNAIDNPEYTTKIAFLGDSITAGSVTSSSSNQYTKQFQTWWEDNISYYVDVNNAGIGATDSYLGVHRVQRDVLDNEPDIIFIEFINDENTEFYKNTMDSLIRKCLSAENKPAVILIEMTMEDGTCPQEVHTEIAEAYNLPVISYHDAVLPEVEAGNITWSDISPDNIHPNDTGHVMLGQMLSDFAADVLENAADDVTESDFDAESPTGDKYANAAIADKTTDNYTVTDEGSFTGTTSTIWNFSNGWATSTGGSITFEMEFQNLGILYTEVVSDTAAIADISIDGETVTSIDSSFPDGWGNYAENEEIYTSDETAKHTVTVTIQDGDAQYFELLGWLIS